jgi:hypothetical protein
MGFSGVRPSPGAATLGRELAIELSTTLENEELAVAEDGHTPLNVLDKSLPDKQPSIISSGYDTQNEETNPGRWPQPASALP